MANVDVTTVIVGAIAGSPALGILVGKFIKPTDASVARKENRMQSDYIHELRGFIVDKCVDKDTGSKIEPPDYPEGLTK